LAELQKAETMARRNVAHFETEVSQATSKARYWQREIRGLRLHRIDDDDDVDEDEDNRDTDKPQDSDADQPSSSQIADGLTQTAPSQPEADGTISSPSGLKKRRGRSTDLPAYTVEQLQESTSCGQAMIESPHWSILRRALNNEIRSRAEEEEVLSVDTQEMKLLEERIASMAPNMAAIEEFRRKAEIYLTRVSELNQVTSVLAEQRKLMDDAKAKRLSEFLDGFHSITAKLKEMYQMITQGGDAELELIDSLDPFSEGIVFSVRPPKKSWKNIANLSGGEKTLSSLALVFALHHYKPTPLYVMDEIDAALDFKNVSIVGNYLKERTKNAQFIVISLRNNMFELSDRLIGIYKTFNITKTITLDPGPLMDRLSKLVVRVATVHGREKDLMEYQQQLQSQRQQQQQQQEQQPQPSSQMTTIPHQAYDAPDSQPVHPSGPHFFEDQAPDCPIKISDVSGEGTLNIDSVYHIFRYRVRAVSLLFTAN
uniref:Structural maintenance of chromosomes protein 4 n=1 Tax=Echinostoma caproni TaxID=27848 RepID=A0A183BCX1_9TREM